MGKIVQRITVTAVIAMFSFAPLLVGCSSSPSEEQARQLKDLKAEVSSLEGEVAAKEKDKADMEKQVAEKKEKLQQCNEDQETIKAAMKK